MSQLKAINALEPFLLLSSSATSPRAATDLITQATSHPNTYVFAELLSTPNIQALATTEHAPYLQLLHTFAYGTVHDYLTTPGLPPLNDAQKQKLMQLSLLSLARQKSPLAYNDVMSSLSITDPQHLELLVTSAIGANLLSATLDPHAQTVHIHSVAPLRDLPPASLPALAHLFSKWSQACADSLVDMKQHEASIRQSARAEYTANKQAHDLFHKKMNLEPDERRAKRVLHDDGPHADGDAMDLDGDSKRSGTKRTLTSIIKGGIAS